MLTTPDTLAEARQRLLAWFEANARDLPWRRTRDPYAILVSEVMLQQTQVDRVIPKYLAFLAAFPTLESLAAAPTAEVIRMWAGLGYNRRAVNLQRTARAVLNDHGGTFPHEVAALRELPGIGPYTAGAVACFAFEQDVAFLDTNIRRVVRRWLVGPEDQEPTTSERQLVALAESAVPAGQGWLWNQAIMELGALICTATAPSCWRCPLREHCQAYAAWRSADEQIFNLPEQRPARPMRRVAERREAPYAGSSRFYRGRVVDALRNLNPGSHTTLAALGPLVKDEFSPADAAWLAELVVGLARDGLVELDGEQVRLPH
ncbi:MAG: A/G-specific adenine glycosylase [Chloroflexaceae bacterium]|jgi:A/G-specific adenine glycosylase|nr:A/G-specific adenine glycosylase [Chloroflexaceae bacterium]